MKPLSKSGRIVGLIIAILLSGVGIYVASNFGTMSVRRVTTLSDVEGNGPGVALMLVQDGRKVFEREIGIVNRGTKAPITSKTNFNLASVYKQFTAYGILILEQEGKIDREDPLSKHIKGLPPWADQIRIKHLLTHSSGIKSDQVPCVLQQISNNEDVLKELQDYSNLRFTPGDHFEYSNTGYVVLASVIETVTGESYRKFLRGRIFTKLEMNSTDVLDAPVRQIKDRALGYNSWPFQNVLDTGPCTYLMGDGGIYSNLDDYVKWLGEIENPVLVDPGKFRELLGTGVRIREGLHYSYGWIVSEIGGKRQIEHRGTWLGFQSYVIGSPDTRSWFVLLSNNSDLDRKALVAEILRQHQQELRALLQPQVVGGF